MALKNTSHSESIQLDDSGLPILGFTILRAAARVHKKDDYQPELDKNEDGSEWTVRMRFSKCILMLTAPNGVPINIGRTYESAVVRGIAPKNIPLYKVKDAMQGFTTPFLSFVASERLDPMPNLQTRICTEDHNGSQEALKWDGTMGFWNCSLHGLFFEEDTRLIPSNPFSV